MSSSFKLFAARSAGPDVLLKSSCGTGNHLHKLSFDQWQNGEDNRPSEIIVVNRQGEYGRDRLYLFLDDNLV
jgi:hypothetical protein